MHINHQATVHASANTPFRKGFDVIYRAVMATSIEPIESFKYLSDNIPQWLAKLNDLNAQCDEQYERFYKLTKHGETKLTRKKKHDSTESLRTKDNTTVPFLQIDNPKEVEPIPKTVTAALAEATQTPQPNAPAPLTPNQPTLKRKPASALSAASGRDGYCTKSMIVVYYDSAIQEGFEGIVKNVSNARSNLRKGRATATFQAHMTSMGSTAECTNTLPSAKIMMPSFGRRKENATEKQKFRVYEEADRDLEEAQNLSERAAHQFLRDGDCNIEMEAMRKRFRAVQGLAEKEFERLKNQEESPEAAEVSKPPVEKGIEQILGRAYPKLPTPLPHSEPTEAETLPPKQMHFAATGAIEVDDTASDGSSIKIDMSAVRRVTRQVV